ncbi:glycine/betaine ABC transporter [Arcobacter sp. CECT 8983]|uniref:BCCT family transporter n=1 Tax=Arcobacter sp. CECT 8983 TaxID=2044508 RepID=UPI00100ACCD1|nr:BCCT family transporter [Arcobacter sp. CECT 8983]RXJ88293.1 glycine/betaine ABC transporter [Arcobacter sp. CECT 8983]
MKRIEYDTEYEAGQDNLKAFGMDMHNPVFFVSALLILSFVVVTIVFPTSSKEILDGMKTWSINNFDWLFMMGGNIFVLFCVALVFSPFGKIRLGGKDIKPEYSRLSWFAMLFAAGMGIGLMFWSVAEPVAYYTGWYKTPLGVEANTEQAADLAMAATMYHWGVHPWAIYGVVGLALAFFSYNKGLPLTVRSAFYPLLGEKVWSWPGHIIDLLAVFATIFGLATSLGLGAKQASSGLSYLFDISAGINTQIGIVIFVTAVAIISVIRGIDGGVKLLSNINMFIATVLLCFVILAGSTLDIFSGVFSTAVSYASNIIPLSNWIDRDDSTWFHGWTVFYWAWWISWSPFVGMFIARVSKGRTVREFLVAVLLIPTLVTIVWMSAFGGSALDQTINNVGALADGITKVPLAMYQMLENLPFTTITSSLAIILVLVFFITSSDSGSLVIDSITSGGKVDAPVPQRIFWASMEGLIAGSLLYIGGKEALQALQAGAITTGLPFTIILILMCISLFKGLQTEIKLYK